MNSLYKTCLDLLEIINQQNETIIRLVNENSEQENLLSVLTNEELTH